MKANSSQGIQPNKQNTLYLTIKQVYFDEIVAGTKKEEYREIKPTTYKRYLQCIEDVPCFYKDLVTLEALESVGAHDIVMWNNGVYPLVPKDDLRFLELAVGYAKERDTMTVEVVDITFEPETDEAGNPLRYADPKMDGHFVPDSNGDFCFWLAVFHLGKIVALHRKGDK